MLDRRIHHRTDYLRIQKTNVRVTSRHYVFLLAPGLRPDTGRVGITVSRKVGTAVVRNRARRLVREALRRMPELVPAGIDMVVVQRCPPGEMRMQDALAEMQSVSKLIARRCQALVATPAGPTGDPP
ncbi:MAG: ribonuclease P protein component [Deltaproteobacteria bacterium]|nr:ribonuclease P protein component [Deltaproteobacteria bacterium]